jgi:hypothetical protein
MRIPLAESVIFEALMIFDQAGENEVADAPRDRHLAFCARHARTDHQVGVCSLAALISAGKYSGG